MHTLNFAKIGAYDYEINFCIYNFYFLSGIFEAITPTTYIAPAITTYKPYENFKDKAVTTQTSFSTSFKPQYLPYTTTTDMRIRSEESETTTSEIFPDLRLTTTLATTTTTEKKPQKISMKSPFNLRSTAIYKYPKQRGLYKPFKNLTTSSTATPPLKKTVKYQRQYKTKKLKQFKHLYTTTSTTTTTTTAPTTTEEYHTKKVPSRTFPTTSTTETTTTRKIVSRTSPTTQATNTRKVSTRFSSTSTEPNNTKKLSSRSSATTEANTPKKQSTRRGSKRAHKPKEKEEPIATTSKRTPNKSRRRHQTSSTTVKSPLTSTLSFSTSSTPLPTSSRTSSTTATTTTMKSIMRIANSKSRSRAQNDIKPYIKNSNTLHDDILSTDDKASLKPITTTKDSSVPPLPIEIYFKKSHNAKTYNANK